MRDRRREKRAREPGRDRGRGEVYSKDGNKKTSKKYFQKLSIMYSWYIQIEYSTQNVNNCSQSRGGTGIGPDGLCFFSGLLFYSFILRSFTYYSFHPAHYSLIILTTIIIYSTYYNYQCPKDIQYRTVLFVRQ